MTLHPRATEADHPRVKAKTVHPASLLALEYVDESGQDKSQLIVQVGRGEGGRSYFTLHQRLGKPLDVFAVHPRLGQQIANLMDGCDPVTGKPLEDPE